MKNLYILLFILPVAASGQGKTFLDFNNERTHVLQGCEGAVNILECYTSKIGIAVQDAVNATANKPDKDELLIELTMMNHPNGEVKVRSVKTDDPEVAAAIQKAFENFPAATPPVVYGPDPGTSTNSIAVKLRKNAGTNQYSLVVPQSNTGKWKKEPHPFAGAITPALFPGCEKSADLKCNAAVLQQWLEKQVDGKIKVPVEERVMLRLTFSDNGKLEKYHFTTRSAELHTVLETALKKYPRITPATMTGKKIATTYAVTVTINVK